MNRRPRGGPGEFDVRLARASQLLGAGGSAADPLTVLVAVLRHQRGRAAAVVEEVARLVADATTRVAAGMFPILDLDAAVAVVDAEVVTALGALDREGLPAVLGESAAELAALGGDERGERIADWLDDPALVAPAAAFWFRVGAGPVLELAAANVRPPSADGWQGSSCPLCGAPPQASVIAEESGEFMGGSPRSLVCGRCASWWSFARATCPRCGEDDPRAVSGFLVPENRTVRVDCCETCHGYVKTFDLRQPGARDIVPLVDDVATLRLDVWAVSRGFERASASFAGA